MRYEKCSLLCLVLVLSTLGPLIEARKSFGRGGGSHSYPKSGGLSGGGSHGYPSSGGLSGSGSHKYPPSGGLSGGGSHGYPSSGGLSGGGSHTYPSSGGLSGGGSSYPHHTNTHGYPASKGVAGGTTNIHHHYNYNPPQQIRYTPVHGGAPQTYPVYHGNPPAYVYQYKDSGSKYGTLLAGLALLNLGTAGAGVYLASKSYKPQPGEACFFGVKKDNGDYEENKIDCNLISTFILQEEKAKNVNNTNTNTTTSITTTTTNITTINGVSDAPLVPENTTVSNPLYQMLPNGTLVPLNESNTNPMNTTTAGNGTSIVVSSTITNTTTVVTNALDVKGKEVQVTPGMECFFRRDSPSHKFRKAVPCGLLQTYAEKSLKKNSAIRNGPALATLSIVVISYFML